jgi:hypothetical protein
VIDELILEVARVDPPNEPGIVRALGVPLAFDDEFPSFVRYRAALSEGPFRDVDVRINKDAPTGLVVLMASPDHAVNERDIDFALYGPETSFDVNPRMLLPAGTFTRTHRVGSAEVRFQFAADTRNLHSVSVVWEKKEEPA